MMLIQASDGRHNLFIYREGDQYSYEKRHIFLKEFTTLYCQLKPQPPDSPLMYHDPLKPFPFADKSFDNLYCYHLFEHLTHKEADFFAAELYRVLKPGGVCRVSTPDLEMIAREYLKYLDASLNDPSETNIKRYRWTVMKLIDQSIRETMGGSMLEGMQSGEFDETYVHDVFGEAYAAFFPSRQRKMAAAAPAGKTVAKRSFLKRLFSLNPRKISKRLEWWRYQQDLKAYKKGVGADMRHDRETVTLLPDKVYLRSKLEKAGFVDFKVQEYNSSDIPNWDKYNLDQSNYGDYPYDPSIYAEVRRKS